MKLPVQLKGKHKATASRILNSMDMYSAYTRRRTRRRTKQGRTSFSGNFGRLLGGCIAIAAAFSFVVLGVRGCIKVNSQNVLYAEHPVPTRGTALEQPTLPPGTQMPAALPPTSQIISLPYHNLSVSIDDTPTMLPLEEYIVGVVAAEMPASSSLEALKAQAVAARTFTCLHITGGAKCGRGADGTVICDDHRCCQAYMSNAELASYWGSSYEANYEKVRNAVYQTEGIVAVFEGKLISAVYHASSGGATENSEAVFAMALPYLVSVDSYEGDTEAVSVSSFSYVDLANKLNAKFDEASLAEDGSAPQIDVWGRTESGRVQLVQIGQTVVSGQQLRMALSLKSSNFTIRFENGNVCFDCIGFGHGVGMSQYGANAMAKEGYTFDTILKHFYTGITLGIVKPPD